MLLLYGKLEHHVKVENIHEQFEIVERWMLFRRG